MASVTGLTAERMLELANANIVDGEVNAQSHLILTTRGGNRIDAGPIVDLVNLIDSINTLQQNLDQLSGVTNSLSNDLAATNDILNTTNSSLTSTIARVVNLESSKYSERKATAVQNLTKNSYTRVSFDSFKYNYIPYNTFTNQFTVPENGLYQVVGAVYIGNGSGGRRILRPVLNGSYTTEWTELFPSQPNTITLAFSNYYMMSSGDTFGVNVMQSSGGTLSTVVNPSAASWIKMVRVK